MIKHIDTNIFPVEEQMFRNNFCAQSIHYDSSIYALWSVKVLCQLDDMSRIQDTFHFVKILRIIFLPNKQNYPSLYKKITYVSYIICNLTSEFREFGAVDM